MQLKASLALLGVLAALGLAQPHGHHHHHVSKRGDWTAVLSDVFTTTGFGGRSTAGTGSIDTYSGNVGNPWGSNIIEIPEKDASKYKYVVKVKGQNSEPWLVVFWNKMGPDGKLDGHYGHSALRFTLNPGDIKYVALDENSQGAFGAYPGNQLPKNTWGGYACTWGEFDFGSSPNGGWSGFDVSGIQAQMSKMPLQGMKICQVGGVCSTVTSSGNFDNAYAAKDHAIGGIGGNLAPGPVRLEVTIDYKG
ncbi:allergen Asp f 4 [Histoplasma capsulatum]|uniref:Allergen Asp f 4 n=1 Tax=Ajellomyces capsulatus TaxID=5037 RepID=A0A8A1M8M2_AJECA|nr:allergen Asp f 4 [Histoplasma mississippiense (nom. inval.)]EDN07586.1 allergen Asp f 4 [Histoplasma mississippiense (nom. inval.)]QSS62321.1 allergen Asp f 4 [Histoplasma capsulatum]